jgi:hypothetical protein
MVMFSLSGQVPPQDPAAAVNVRARSSVSPSINPLPSGQIGRNSHQPPPGFVNCRKLQVVTQTRWSGTLLIPRSHVRVVPGAL